MARQFEGRLVRFANTGVGVVDVAERPEYVYFSPRHIVGYKGETLRELTSSREGWTDGKTVIIRGDVGPGGTVQVESVALKR